MKTLIEEKLGTDIDVHGYRILVLAPAISEKTKGGIILSDSLRALESRGHNIGLVLKLGPLAYQPSEKFGGKPYCNVGDWVIYSSYERDEIKINDKLCFFINDERIYATIPDINVIKGLDL
jgi:co-chaperonin GroES (HSP10)